MTDPWTVILVHVLTMLPPTLVGIAGLVTAVRGRRDTGEVRVIVNGQRTDLETKLAEAVARIQELES